MHSLLFFLLIRHFFSSYGAYNCAENQQTPWFRTIFGSYLSNTFSCSATLELAVNETQTKVEKNGDLGIMGFMCTNYQEGAKTARLFREVYVADVPSLIPFLVDQENNQMCFITVNHPDILLIMEKEREGRVLDPLFSTYFQETLKIHETVNNFLFNEYYENNRLADYSLIMRYRQEYFEENPGEDATRSIDHYTHLINRLRDYDMRIMNSFFWTSPGTNNFFENAEEPISSDSRFLHDYSTYEGWMSLKNYLTEKLNSNKDPCKFDSMRRHVDTTAGKLNLPLQEIAHGDNLLFRSCLSFIISTVAQDPAIHHLSMRLRPVLLNYRARSIEQSAQVGSTSAYAPYTASGLLGDGQVVTIADTGVDSFSCYFYDPQGQVAPTDVASPSYDMKYRKVIQYNYNGCGATIDAQGGHGTHVCGIITGGISGININVGNAVYDGVAPNAKLSVSSLGKPDTGLCIPPISQLYGPGYNAGSRVHSNSWGSYFTGNRYYTDQDTDRYLYTTQAANIFFAAGNAGNNGDGSNTITIEGSSKNVIAVGSSQTTLGSQNITYVAWYSSKGPAYDNRIKPDLVSPGDSLLSAYSQGNGQQSCSTIQMTGTSMASPSAAGAGALVRQYFVDNNSQFWRAVCNPGYPSCRSFVPSGALVKGILLHSGSSMTMFAGGGSKNIQLGAGPDSTQGFGRITFMNVLPLKGIYQNFDLFVADAVNMKENMEIIGNINIANSNIPLRASISWYDPPNVEGVTTKALINNLDLSLISPNQQTFYPNGLSNPDSLNNFERVIINKPQSGTWKVRITSVALPGTGNQLFALIVTAGGRVGALEEIMH